MDEFGDVVRAHRHEIATTAGLGALALVGLFLPVLFGPLPVWVGRSAFGLVPAIALIGMAAGVASVASTVLAEHQQPGDSIVALLGRAAAILARALVVLAVLSSLADPASIPGGAIGTVATALGQSGLAAMLTMATAVVVVIVFLSVLVDSEANGTPAILALPFVHLARWLGRHGVRLGLALAVRLLALAGLVTLRVLAWIMFGATSQAALSRPSESQTGGGLAKGLAAAASWLRAASPRGMTLGAGLGASLFASRPRATAKYRDAIVVRRTSADSESAISDRLPRVLANTEAADLLAFARAIAASYRLALDGAGGGRPGPEGPKGQPARGRLNAYELRVSAWLNDRQHAFVVEVSPQAAAQLAHSVGADQLIPLLDAETTWTGPELRSRLTVGDARLREDPLLEGQRGIYVTIMRSEASEEAAPQSSEADPVRGAIARGLAEQGLPRTWFRFTVKSDGYDTTTYHYMTDHWRGGVPERRAVITRWLGLRDAVGLYAGVPDGDINLYHDPSDHSFALTIKVPPKPFPGDKPGDTRTSLRNFIADHADAMRAAPRRFCVGLDYCGEPVWCDLGDPLTPHALVVGGTGSGKTVSGVVGPVLQLATINSPDRMRLWLVDSPKRELRKLLGRLPHVEHLVIARDGETVAAALDAYIEAMTVRQGSADGYKWSPRSGDPWNLLIVEEWQALTENLKGGDQAKLLDQLAAKIAQLTAIGRSAGFHVLVASQKGTDAVLPTRIKLNLPLHIVGRSPAADYQQMLGTQKVPTLGTAGRLAVVPVTGYDEPVIVQGLTEVAPARGRDDEVGDRVDRGLLAVVEDIVRRSGVRVTPLAEEDPIGSHPAAEPAPPPPFEAWTTPPRSGATASPAPGRPTAEPTAPPSFEAWASAPTMAAGLPSAAQVTHPDSLTVARLAFAYWRREQSPFTADDLTAFAVRMGLPNPPAAGLAAGLRTLEAARVVYVTRSAYRIHVDWPTAQQRLRAYERD